MKTRIRSVLNKFMGVEVFDATLEGDSWTIDVLAACPAIFSMIVRKSYQCNGTVSVYSPDSSEFMYWLSIPENEIKDFLNELEDDAIENPFITEQLDEIDCYDLFDSKGRKKYLKFVKHLRRLDILGWQEWSAAEVLNCYRDMFDAPYTKADEVRAVLEFKTPHRALKALARHPAAEPDDNYPY